MKDWRKKHGMSRTKFYCVYRDIKRRTENKKDIQYHLYGGKGIKCEWESFGDFKKDMYKSYLLHRKNNPGYRNTSINRVDNNGNYCKKNCRWATHKEQQRNKTTTVYITYKGTIKTRKEWSEITGIPDYSIYNRIHVYKWPLEKVFTVPKSQHQKKYTV